MSCRGRSYSYVGGFSICCVLLLICAGCSQSERGGDLASTEDSSPAIAEPASETLAPPEIVSQADTKETVSLWSALVKKQLKALAESLTDDQVSPGKVLAPAVKTFNPDELELVELHQGSVVRVSELRLPDDSVSISAQSGHFLSHLRQVFALDEEQALSSAHFKLFAIDRDEERLTTRQRLTTRGVLDGHVVHSSAVVDAAWILPDEKVGGEPPRLLTWSMPLVVRNERDADGDAGFDDIAPLVLGANAAWDEQLQVGMNTWRRHIERSLNPDFLGYHGLAVGDIDGDGWEDLYVCQPGGLPNLMFQRQADGTMVDVSAAAGVDWLDNTTAALLVDLDNDGDPDLAAATRSAFLIMENDGRGRFSLVRELRQVGMGYSPTAIDFDLDGDLDLLILRYATDGKVGDFPTPHPFHSARNGGQNVLLANQGEFHFVDVTDDVGLGIENFRFSFAAAWEDYDNDGDSDLYIANDFGPNQLFRNDGGVFTDQSDVSGTQDWGFGMSATWSDYDRDGNMDLYVSSMFSGAGNQVVPQSDFNPKMSQETRAKYLKMVRGNTLLRNSGSGTFADVTTPMAEGFAGWAWGAQFADFDNDGWEDLYVANGYISQPDTDDL